MLLSPHIAGRVKPPFLDLELPLAFNAQCKAHHAMQKPRKMAISSHVQGINKRLETRFLCFFFMLKLWP